ncbi:MAG: IS110 family transposase [Rhodococcus sp. (in: high G+C Gram-positive bacteria)]|nr:IS110 family transposase [Rhodococcus sp. (in: high G+C Gram-positive bacteria)]MDI6627152.1 IS110 family transposase [Rhodococcus sp. (in: high G+C Gram-positive bacteria)]
MTRTARRDQIIAGVDTHADTIHVAVIDKQGRDLDDRELPTTPAGYRAALAFIAEHGRLDRIRVEGTSSYGAGFTRAARRAGHLVVVEVTRPDRAERRRVGKSDPIDAYLAARAAQSGRANAVPKNEQIEPLRALHNAPHSAVKARTAAINQIHSILITAPEAIRTKYGLLKLVSMLAALAKTPTSSNEPHDEGVLIALFTIAQRVHFLDAQIGHLTTRLDAVVTATNPGLRAAQGIGPDTAAQLLITAGSHPDRLTTEGALTTFCGVSPVPASSGRTIRHRLSRGGDRGANNALYRIALVQMSTEPRTRAYVARQRAAGRPTPEITRMLKRGIVREVFHLLTTTVEVPDINDLRSARQARHITLTSAAQHLQVWPTTISQLELGKRRNDDLANTYRKWLLTA